MKRSKTDLKSQALKIAYQRLMHENEVFGFPNDMPIPLQNELIKLGIELNEKHKSLTGEYIAPPGDIVFADEPVFFDYLYEVLSQTEEFKRVFPGIDPAEFYMEYFQLSEEQDQWLKEQEAKWDGSYYLNNPE